MTYKKLISYRGIKTTEDVQKGISALESRLSKIGDVVLKITPSDLTSLGGCGRELRLELKSDKYSREQCVLLLWGNAIPCGFTPLDRYPNLGLETSPVFHFYGHWQVLLDNHFKEGAGEFAFDSLCCACACEVNLWGGGRFLERQVQSHLHRLGYSVGLVNGILEEPAQQAIRSLGLAGLSLETIVERLVTIEKTTTTKEDQTGYLVLPNIPHRVYSYGEVNTVVTTNGASITARGAGRIVVDLQ